MHMTYSFTYTNTAVIVVEDGAAEELVNKWQQQLAANPSLRKPVGGSMDEVCMHVCIICIYICM